MSGAFIDETKDSKDNQSGNKISQSRPGNTKSAEERTNNRLGPESRSATGQSENRGTGFASPATAVQKSAPPSLLAAKPPSVPVTNKLTKQEISPRNFERIGIAGRCNCRIPIHFASGQLFARIY